MSWNNRIFKHVRGGEILYALHECYYDEAGKVDGYTLEPMTGFYESVPELLADLRQKLNDAERSKDDVLDYEEDPSLSGQAAPT